MEAIFYKPHRLPPTIIQHAVWLYFRFTLNLSYVEELLAERRIEISYKTVRCRARKFGPAIAHNLRSLHRRPDVIWRLDEMATKIGGQRMYMRRAVDKEDVVLDAIVQKRRNKAAELKLLRKLLKSHGLVPDKFLTDGLSSCKAAMKELSCQTRHEPSRLRENNRAENSNRPIRRRERKMQSFKSQ